MKESDAITHAINEFEVDYADKLYPDKEVSKSILETFGKRVLRFYKIPYSKEIRPINGKLKERTKKVN